jgi:hypothetical protein
MNVWDYGGLPLIALRFFRRASMLSAWKIWWAAGLYRN